MWNINGNLVFKIVKLKQSTAELDHGDLLSVYRSSFAQMPISRENMNVYCSDLIGMVLELNFFKKMQIDYPRWRLGVVTKIA